MTVIIGLMVIYFGEAARLGVRFSRLQQILGSEGGGGVSGSAWQGRGSDKQRSAAGTLINRSAGLIRRGD